MSSSMANAWVDSYLDALVSASLSSASGLPGLIVIVH
jgi:hypothetical protein